MLINSLQRKAKLTAFPFATADNAIFWAPKEQQWAVYHTCEQQPIPGTNVEPWMIKAEKMHVDLDHRTLWLGLNPKQHHCACRMEFQNTRGEWTVTTRSATEQLKRDVKKGIYDQKESSNRLTIDDKLFTDTQIAFRLHHQCDPTQGDRKGNNWNYVVLPEGFAPGKEAGDLCGDLDCGCTLTVNVHAQTIQSADFHTGS